MYGGFITPPNDPEAHFGVLFWHKDGFSTACGHGTIALGHWAVARGIVKPKPGGTVDVVVDVPSGRVVARAAFDDAGEALCIDFINVTSYQLSRGNGFSVTMAEKRIQLSMDLSFAGAIYACIDAESLGLRIEPGNHQIFIDLSRQVKAQYSDFRYREKYDIYGVCFYEEQPTSQDTTSVHQRNVVVFADGQIDRSPCGSGTCARLAVLLAQGRVSEEKGLIHESIVGSRFAAHVVETIPNEGDFPACIPRVRGTARLVGKMNFFIDPNDPIYPGFVLR